MPIGFKKKAQKTADGAADKVAKARAKVDQEADKLLASLSDKVSDARVALSDWAEDGADTARAGLAAAVKKTKRGVRDLDRKWKKMSTGQKAAVVGGLLAVLAAAAAAPKVVKKLKGR
jgi:hypothetical protein